MSTRQHRWCVDSIGDFVASIEVDHDRMVSVPQWVLPRIAQKGDVLSVFHEISDDGERSTLRIAIDHIGTKRLREAAIRA